MEDVFMTSWIYFFNDKTANDRHLLGGKGANLAEMTQLNLPVPPGFTITTQSCIRYLDNHQFFTEELTSDIKEAIHKLEQQTHKHFTETHSPILLVSVRSGAAISMPGMMDTILNLGLNDQRVLTFAKETDLAFAFNCYRRLMQMFADVVYFIPKEAFDQTDQQFLTQYQQTFDELSLQEHEELIKQYHQIFEKHQHTFPQDPVEQLYAAIQAVFNSWNNHRAKVYRNLHGIDHNLGTAVNIQSMVFGNRGNHSGTGVAFTRNPSTGDKTLFGEYLINAQGEDIVAGIRTPEPIDQLKHWNPTLYQEFQTIANQLENHYQDMQDIEFTIEENKLYILQTRSGKRTAQAGIKIAHDLAEEEIISKKEALLRITPEMVESVIHPIFDEHALSQVTPIAKGLPASPGAATGIIVFDAQTAQEKHKAGESVILMRKETSPEDIEGMIVSEAIITTHGGMTSHAAVVARGMGICCVSGCADLSINEAEKQVTINEITLNEGDLISVDGSTGYIYKDHIQRVHPDQNHDLTTLLTWADQLAHLKVRANAETVKDIQTALSFGATGIGLARTEHMFFGEKRMIEMRRLILSDDPKQQEAALKALKEFQKQDFKAIFSLIQDKPIVIRLLDPPLHEFLPHTEEEIRMVAKQLNQPEYVIQEMNNALQETNPMLGHRGCRLGITHPEIYQMQVSAIIESAISEHKNGNYVSPEIMIPLISNAKELNYLKQILKQTIDQHLSQEGITLSYKIGTMIELPRACCIADQLAQEAEFFSFGTNDLTQMTYGMSRDDIGKFIARYQKHHILEKDPFKTIDQEGVGQLMQLGINKIKSVSQTASIGVCGEVGGDPESITFFETLNIDYVSCSPYRIPVARLASAHAGIKDK